MSQDECRERGKSEDFKFTSICSGARASSSSRFCNNEIASQDAVYRAQVERLMRDPRIVSFTAEFRNCLHLSGCQVARKCVDVIRSVIGKSKDLSPTALIEVVSRVGSSIMRENRAHFLVCTIILRVLGVIRSEKAALCRKSGCSEELKAEIHGDELRHLIFERLEDILTDLKQEWYPTDSTMRDVFVHVTRLLICGQSSTVVRVLKSLRASHLKRKVELEIVVVTGDAKNEGAQLANRLAADGFCVICIPLQSVRVFAQRCHAAITGAFSVTCTGAAIALAGTRIVAEAFRAAMRPLHVAAALFKVSPMKFVDKFVTDKCLQHTSMPAPMHELQGLTIGCTQFDCIPPSLITSFVTNIGDIHPTVIYGCVKHLYYDEDLHLTEELG